MVDRVEPVDDTAPLAQGRGVVALSGAPRRPDGRACGGLQARRKWSLAGTTAEKSDESFETRTVASLDFVASLSRLGRISSRVPLNGFSRSEPSRKRTFDVPGGSALRRRIGRASTGLSEKVRFAMAASF